MPSIRKRVVGFIRQFSHSHQSSTQDQRDGPPKSSGCFIQRYLSGDEQRQQQPAIVHTSGNSGRELPVRHLGLISPVVFAAFTGPDGGVTTVNTSQRHVSTSDPDVDFIDEQSSSQSSRRSSVNSSKPLSLASPRHHSYYFNSGLARSARSVDNSVMNIRAMGLVYSIGGEEGQGKRSVHTSVSDLCDFQDEQNNNEEDFPILPPPAEYCNNAESGAMMHRSCSAPASPLYNGGANKSTNNHKYDEGMFDGQEGDDCDTLAKCRHMEIAGVTDWYRPHPRVYGAATSLYERHPVTRQNAGNPIADAFAVVARENSAVLALADGVNWGEKASLAARAAVHGSIDYLNKVIFGTGNKAPPTPRPTNTADIFVALLRSFHMAHSLILQEGGMLTTLTAAVVLPLQEDDQYIVCVCNVGDSLAYVYSPHIGVREITQGSHDIHSMRDMRDALGALGPVDGHNPELNNLTCSMTQVQTGDIVFLTSDGISDNFDPVVGKFAVAKKNSMSSPLPSSSNRKPRTGVPSSASAGSVLDASDDLSAVLRRSLPLVEAHQRHELTLMRMEDLLAHGVSGRELPCRTAQELCLQLVDFASKLTVAKRRILEDPELYVADSEGVELSRSEQRCRRRKVCERLAMVPGKLDHASVVAYTVGEYSEYQAPSRLLETGL